MKKAAYRLCALRGIDPDHVSLLDGLRIVKNWEVAEGELTRFKECLDALKAYDTSEGFERGE